MDNRRFLLFLSLSLLVWIGWMNLMQRWYPPPKKQPRSAVAGTDADLPPVDALRPANVTIEPPVPRGMPQHPAKKVTLGSADPASGFFLNVQLTTLGGAIDFIELNDPRYPEFGDRQQALKVLGHDPRILLRTFGTGIPAFDEQLPPGGNRVLNWEVIAETLTESVAEFRLTSPDGSLEFTKRYELKRPSDESLLLPDARDTLFAGYQLVLAVKVRNLSAEGRSLEYALQGPVSLPLEDADNSSKYRDIRMGFLEPKGGVDHRQMTAAEVVKKHQAALEKLATERAAARKRGEDLLDEEDSQIRIEEWKRPLKYIGVDVKYFAALIQPLGDQLQQQTVISSQAQLVSQEKDSKFSDVSVLLTSAAELAAAGSADDTVTHEYLLFVGPKRQTLLSGVAAESIVDFGYVDIIARAMLWILNSFHWLGASYGVAIILLTVVVRAAMFPVSRHQAHNMQRMKELQPKIKEIQAKHAGNKEELARAQMELYRKHNFNPLAGCLPLFLQLPIFIGLYTALSSSVDLRMRSFLWFDNLASPDALFKLPFVVPWFGWTDFNLLPVISTALMYFQAKMMTPPPADEEQAMQQKMMNFMMIFMGAMFYRVPSGLCIYFIASSAWGMIERWLLNRLSPVKKESETPTATEAAAAPDSGQKPATSRLSELWNRMQEAADKDVSITRTNGDAGPSRNGKKKKK